MRGLISIISSLVLVVVTGPAFAQSARKMAEHGDWAHLQLPGDERQGMLRADRAEAEVHAARQGRPWRHVLLRQPASRPGSVFEPQFIAGYNLKEGSKVSVTIGDKKFSMFTKGKSAWVENAAEEPVLIAAMKGGSDMKVQAQSGRGNKTSYAFSLKGISAALCSIPAASRLTSDI